MKVWAKYSTKLLLLLAVFLAASVSIRANGLDATATYTDMKVSPGVFQYDLTLNNTGTHHHRYILVLVDSGRRFHGRKPHQRDVTCGLDAIPSPTCGASIQWLTAAPIALGTSVTGFMFDSTMTPAQFMGTFAGPGLGTGRSHHHSTLYIGCRHPFGDPGAQITAMTAAVVGTPEPSSLSLAAIAMGLLVLAAGISRKRVVSL